MALLKEPHLSRVNQRPHLIEETLSLGCGQAFTVKEGEDFDGQLGFEGVGVVLGHSGRLLS